MWQNLVFFKCVSYLNYFFYDSYLFSLPVLLWSIIDLPHPAQIDFHMDAPCKEIIAFHSSYKVLRRQSSVPMHRSNFSFQWILWLKSKNLCSLRNTFQMFTYCWIPDRRFSFLKKNKVSCCFWQWYRYILFERLPALIREKPAFSQWSGCFPFLTFRFLSAAC